MYYANTSAIMFSALLFALTYFTPTATVMATVMPLLVCSILSAYKTTKSIDTHARNKLQEKVKNPKIATIIAPLLITFLYVIILSSSISLFPTQIVQGNIMVNVFIHYAGSYSE
ncbi:MAG: hypothetical protein QXG11_06600 [Candidatus Bathyarchaeia archaeon]